MAMEKTYLKTTAQETFPEFSQIFEHQTHPKRCSGQESETPNANNQQECHHDHVRHHKKERESAPEQGADGGKVPPKNDMHLQCYGAWQENPPHTCPEKEQ